MSALDRLVRIYRRTGRVVGAVFAWPALASVYFLVFVPARVILAVLGRDILRRKPDRSVGTYWISCQGDAGRDRLRRPY
jgi:hypothetical protein